MPQPSRITRTLQALLRMNAPGSEAGAGRRQERAAATLRQDVRHAFRLLRRSPGFTLVALVTLAIGIGATTAIFSTLSAVLLKDLPYGEPDRLVAGYKTRDGRPNAWVSIVDYFDFREYSRSFDQLAATQGGGVEVITGGAEPELVSAAAATWNMFPALGVQPALGRSFLPDEETTAAGETVLISHGLWQRRFAGSPDVVGSTISLDSSTATVVGVLPAGFRFLHDADVWHLITRDILEDSNRDAHSHWIVGRLRPDVSLAQAQEEVSAIARRLEEQYPDTNKGKGLGLMDLRDFMAFGVVPNLQLLMATAALVLLVACGNVAGLLLARGQQRRSEMAMRSVLGAPRWRLVRQLVTETLVLTAAAGVAGIALAYACQGLLQRVMPLGDPGMPSPAIDAGVLLFAVVVSVVSGLLVGAVPALRSTSVNLSQQIGPGVRATEGVRGTRLRSGLVVVQVAVSILLLIGSGLLVRSMINLVEQDLGFDPENLFTAGVLIQETGYASPEARNLFFSSLLEEVRALPDVVSSATVSKLPIASTSTDWPVWPADQPRPSIQDARTVLARWASPGYFETVGIPLVTGRDLADTDVADGLPVVVISEAVARDLLPDRDPIGQRLGIGWEDQTFEVVGVVADARINGLRSTFDRAMYLSPPQVEAPHYMSLVVRTRREPEALAEEVRRLVRHKDPTAMMLNPRSMASIVAAARAGFRVVLTSLGLLSLLALLLTAIGLYGVLATQVSQRGNELGVRMAIGASRLQIVGLVFARGLTLVGGGVLLGLACAWPATRFLRQMLFGVEPLDLATYLAATGFLAAVVLLACFEPALRATRVNLAEVLRRT